MIDLTDEQRRLVTGVLRKWMDGREVYAFGSRTNGKARMHSDLDLAVVGDDELSIVILAGLRDDFEESDLPFRVDIVLWQGLSPAMKEAILRNGQRMSDAPLGEVQLSTLELRALPPQGRG